MNCSCVCVSILLLGAAPVSARAQAAAEAALGAGRAAGMGAHLKKTGERMGAVLEGAGKSVDTRRRRSAAAQTSQVTLVPAPSKPAPAPTYEDPSGIQTGMDYEEVLRRFGPPPALLEGTAGKTLCYTSKGAPLDVEVRGGKVVSVRSGTTAALH